MARMAPPTLSTRITAAFVSARQRRQGSVFFTQGHRSKPRTEQPSSLEAGPFLPESRLTSEVEPMGWTAAGVTGVAE